jgi:hypothetical protein
MRERSRTQSARYFLCGPVALGIAALGAPPCGWAGTGVPDAQLWTELDVTGPLTSNTTITGIGQLRLSESLPNPTLTALGADLNYKAGLWTFSAGYRHELSPQRPEESIEGRDVKITQVALLMARYAKRFGRSTLAFRFRFDDTINATSNPYRVRIRAEYRWATEELPWMSYVFASDEVFYGLQGQGWYRNRFRIGANLILTKRTTLDVFYQRQDSNNSTPGAINALGLTAAVNFD